MLSWLAIGSVEEQKARALCPDRTQVEICQKGMHTIFRHLLLIWKRACLLWPLVWHWQVYLHIWEACPGLPWRRWCTAGHRRCSAEAGVCLRPDSRELAAFASAKSVLHTSFLNKTRSFCNTSFELLRGTQASENLKHLEVVIRLCLTFVIYKVSHRSSFVSPTASWWRQGTSDGALQHCEQSIWGPASWWCAVCLTITVWRLCVRSGCGSWSSYSRIWWVSASDLLCVWQLTRSFHSIARSRNHLLNVPTSFALKPVSHHDGEAYFTHMNNWQTKQLAKAVKGLDFHYSASL